MTYRLLISLVAGLFCSISVVYPQSSEIAGWDNALDMLLSDEDLSADAREELMFMYESIHDSPLNINTATRDELAQLPFLTYEQIEDIHAYIYVHGPMLTLGELQLTGSLDYTSRQLLRHFVYAGDVSVKREKIRMDDVLRSGRNEVITRMDIPLYVRDGFRYHTPQELERYPNRAYLGTRLSHSVRYSFNWHNRIRFGFAADKDAGEPFMGRNRMGYDFYSPYLYIKDMGMVKELALGNFKAQFGQGLLVGGGFSLGKSMALTNMQRSGQGLKPHASTQEYGYLSGAGIALRKGHTAFTVLGASTPTDATLRGDSAISSFKEDGYHRTELEWSKKRNVRLDTWAANVRYEFRGLRYGGTVLYEHLSLPYKGQNRFWGVSADLSLGRPRYALAMELTLADSKPALICWESFRMGRGWSVTSLFRYYSPEYGALHSNAVADGSVRNEVELLTGFNHSGRNLKINGYADLFMHPKPGYGASERSNGMDLRMDMEWRTGRLDNICFTARFKSKQQDCKYTGKLEYCLTGRYRVRWIHTCHSGGELNTQLHYVRYDFIAQPISNGIAVIQSYNRSLVRERLDLNVTAAVFCTQSYDSRVMFYESGLRYAYNFMTLYGKGGHASVTVKYRIDDSFQINFKAGGTRYSDRDWISSAQQRIDACHKEDVSIQLICRF